MWLCDNLKRSKNIPRCRERPRQVDAVLGWVGGGTPQRLPWIRSRSPVRSGEIVDKALALAIWKAAHGQALPGGEFRFHGFGLDQI